MTTLDGTPISALTETPDVPSRESIWDRIVFHLGTMFGRMWGYLNEDMGIANEDDGDYYSPGGCCCL